MSKREDENDANCTERVTIKECIKVLARDPFFVVTTFYLILILFIKAYSYGWVDNEKWKVVAEVIANPSLAVFTPMVFFVAAILSNFKAEKEQRLEFLVQSCRLRVSLYLMLGISATVVVVLNSLGSFVVSSNTTEIEPDELPIAIYENMKQQGDIIQ